MDALDPASWAALAGIGLVAGFLSTLFGIGGGLVVVPLLAYGMGIDFRVATAVSLMAMAVQAPLGVWTHARRGAVDWRMGAWLAGGGALGVLAGHWLQPQVEVAHLKLLFAAVMAFAAWRLWVRIVQGVPRRIPIPGLVALGLAAGLAARLLGIGGGLVTVPALVLLGTLVHTAIASSLVPVFTNAAIATGAVLAKGDADWRLALPLAFGALAAAPIGTRTAHALQARPLRRLFAAALSAAALAIAATSGAIPGVPL